MDKNILQFSPLTEATYYILLSLVEPIHGYGVIKKVGVLTDNRLKLAAGTLYGAIKSLLDNKLIELVSIEKKNKGKKMYQVTTNGKKLLYYELNRLREMVSNGISQVGDYYE